MPSRTELTREIYEAPDGPKVGAFFDFDGTLIAGYSAFPFLKAQLRARMIGAADLRDILTVMANLQMGKADFDDLLATTAALMKGAEESDYITFGEKVYEKHIAKLVYPETRTLVEAHLDKGHTVAIISSATRYQVEPTARDLDVEHVFCSELEVEDGAFTGEVIQPARWGEGKVDAARELAKSHGIVFKNSFFYSDGFEDMPLLNYVGNPRPLNPGFRLAETARRKGWPVRRFKSRGRKTAMDYTRAIAATYSLIPSFAAGIPVWALTGSRQQGLNFSMSLFADAAGALIGLDLKVKNEHHLWEHRPAVFVFNHQSKSDVVIIGKLIRRDLAGVGKQEIKRLPIIGKIFEYGGVVMIDRKNATSAIEAMAPLVEVMRKENKSVCLAPEGTRSVSKKLGPFKKGAFHLAMQAGVPMVPIVIHNALDSAPKGEFVFRPATVEVEVLPPIDTSSWTPKTVDEHVRDVRNMFLKALGQHEDTADASGEVKVSKKAKPKSAAKRKTTAEKEPAAKKKTAAGKKSATKKSTTAKKKPAAKKKTTAERGTAGDA